ncbi:MAG: amidase [Gammaproteobacteria bacterium]|nr:amidase [Gammaproteobacteria bacterium]
MSGLLNQGVLALAGAYRAGAASPVEVMEAVFSQLDQVEPTLNAFQLVDRDAAMADAQAAARRWASDQARGPLDGVPISIKDIVAVQGWPTRSGSRATDASPNAEDCPPVARLREAGAVLFGKTTTPEFGWKGMTDSPLAGVTRNPWDPRRTPGGSSGGAAAAVAVGLGPLALGSDGGGSIRIPASFCGVVGFKPTFGRVASAPMRSPYSTVTSCGPIARSVADCAAMMNVLAKPDTRDWHALPADGCDYVSTLGAGVEGVRVGVSLSLGGIEPNQDIAMAVQTACASLDDVGCQVRELGAVIEPLRDAFEALWLLGFAFRVSQIPQADWSVLDPGLLALAKQGMALGLADHQASDLARMRLGEQFAVLHQDVDILITPTMPRTPPLASVDYASEDNDRWRDGAPYTLPFNLTGQPAISIPCGLDAAGMPVGLQIVGAKYQDALVLRVANALEAGLGRESHVDSLVERLAEAGPK